MYKSLILSWLIALMTSLVTVFIYPHQPDIATVDISAITTDFIKEEAKKAQSTDEKEEAIRAYSHALESAIETLVSKKNVVLVPKEAVIKGASDYTLALKRLMSLEKKP